MCGLFVMRDLSGRLDNERKSISAVAYLSASGPNEERQGALTRRGSTSAEGRH
jgi:hypothetical protein